MKKFRLGQHFLRDKSALKKIVEALDLRSGDFVVEIGAGHGELTSEFARQFSTSDNEQKKDGWRVVAIEKDKNLADELKKKFAGENNVEIIEGDALKLLPSIVRCQLSDVPAHYKCAGNIPYYITGKLLRILSELEVKPSLCVFTLQKEVAERIIAGPPKTNRLSAITQFWAEPEILFYIPRKDFSPPPEVDSAVIKLTTRTDADWARTDADRYYRAVKILFQQPRQTILNNLVRAARAGKSIGINQPNQHKSAVAENLRRIGINPQDRPQDLGVQQIIKIARLNF